MVTPSQPLTHAYAAGIAIVAFLVGAGIAALVASNLAMTLLTQAVITGLLATGVGFLIRQNGMVSFGHAAFYGIACYAIALAMRHGIVRAELQRAYGFLW